MKKEILNHSDVYGKHIEEVNTILIDSVSIGNLIMTDQKVLFNKTHNSLGLMAIQGYNIEFNWQEKNIILSK